ncbi:MAG: ZIP family metal transporter [Candidatus Nanoarchaeia archaeon]
MDLLYLILLVTIIDGLVALSGAVILIFSKNYFNKLVPVLVAFSVGALIGGAALHLIPESIEHFTIPYTIVIIFLGFFLFFILEKIIHWRHCHDEHCKVHPYSYLILYGDAMHNFIDGILIASSFLVSVPIGIVTSILVIAHEFPQEIGYFGVLVHGGISKKKALLYNFISQSTAILGGLAGYFFLSAQKYASYLLPLAAGGFIYIAFQDLIPELFKEKDKRKILISIIAIILGFLVLFSAKMFVE